MTAAAFAYSAAARAAAGTAPRRLLRCYAYGALAARCCRAAACNTAVRFADYTACRSASCVPPLPRRARARARPRHLPFLPPPPLHLRTASPATTRLPAAAPLPRTLRGPPHTARARRCCRCGLLHHRLCARRLRMKREKEHSSNINTL